MGLTAKKVYAVLNRKIKKISGDVSSLGTPLFYAGSVTTADLLPVSPKLGAVYNIEQKSIYGESGTNVVWNGVLWDSLGPTFDLSLLLTKENAKNLYLQKNQGSENSGKFLVVGEDGNVILSDTQDGGVKTDTTLTKSGEAADAKVVGDKITTLKEDLTEIAHDVSVLKATKTGKLYGVKKWKASVNPTSTCEKTRDNVGLVCEPSTDKEQGRDDYADIPLFQWRRCNYKRYDDGFAYPIAFEGDVDYNDKDNADVGNIYQTFWYNEIDMGDYAELIISDSPNYQLGLRPWEEAVRADGTIMPYFIFSAYTASVGSDEKWYSLPNKKELGFCSHNLMIDNFQKKGKGYWGASVRRNTFAMIFSQIKYGTKNIQSVMNGCTNYNFQIKASVQSESKNTYFPILKGQAGSIVVGAYVSVGYGQAKSDKSVNLDRGVATIGAYGDTVKVLRVEDLDGVNSAVYLECEPFSTMPVQDKTETDVMCEIVMSSMPWWTGSTDKVLGHHDGSLDNKSGKFPCRIQGIEFFSGRYQIPSDVATMFQPDYSKDVYFAKRGVAHSKSDSVIKETYEKIGNIPASANGEGSDYWIGDVTIKKGAWFPSSELATSQSYGDRVYSGGTSTSGSREYLQGGNLWNGSNAGLAYLNCRNRLDRTNWNYAVADAYTKLQIVRPCFASFKLTT